MVENRDKQNKKSVNSITKAEKRCKQKTCTLKSEPV